jgi:hypothetical protein
MSRMSTVKLRLATALAAAALAAPMAASAALVTQLIHFDDASNGWKWYSDKDLNFLFDPTNLQSSTLCANSTNGGNGSCVIEGTQGALPKMTRPKTGPQSQGDTNSAPAVTGADPFTLDAFYFLLNGEGGRDKDTGAGLNAITVAGSNGTSFTFKLGSNWDAGGAPDVRFYEGANAGALAGDLVKDTGYIVTFGDLFKDVTWIQFSAPSTAQVRLDCVVATFEGTTTEPHKGFGKGEFCGIGTNGGGGGGGGNAPEPASLALVGLGLLGAAAVRRRRSR